MTVELVRASLSDKAVLRRLLQLYRYDFSEWNGDDVDEHGEFGHRYLDHYWTDQDSHPFLIRQAGRWAGFALVRTEGVNDMSEFFVMRKRAVVPSGYEETVTGEGPVQRFTILG